MRRRTVVAVAGALAKEIMGEEYKDIE